MSANTTARSGAGSRGHGGRRHGSRERSGSKRGAVPLGRNTHLQLVTDHGRLVNPGFVAGEAVWVTGRAVRNEVGQRPGGRAEPGVRRDGGAERGPAGGPRPSAEAVRRLGDGGRRPVRLTRRGRLVLASAIVVLIAVLAMVLASVA